MKVSFIYKLILYQPYYNFNVIILIQRHHKFNNIYFTLMGFWGFGDGNGPSRSGSRPTETELIQMPAKSKIPLRGAVKPRLENKPLNTKNRGAEVAELAASIGAPLMEWQQYVLDDLLSINEEGKFIRRSSLLIAARQVGKSHIGRMRAIAGLVLFGEKNQLIMSSNRSMALTN
jgi:hypothetical protein